MSEGCTHDCSTCGENCSERKAEDMKLRQNDYSNIKKGYSGSQRQGRRRQEPCDIASCLGFTGEGL